MDLDIYCEYPNRAGEFHEAILTHSQPDEAPCLITRRK